MSYYVIIPYSYIMRMLYEKGSFFYLWSLELGHNTIRACRDPRGCAVTLS